MYSKIELEKMIRSAGYQTNEIRYPYPDYMFTSSIYSDDRLPQKGELNKNRRNYSQERMKLFDEEKVFDQIIDDGMFPYFSNAYLMVIS